MAIVSLKRFLKDKGFLERTVRNSVTVSKQSDIIIKRRVAGLKGVALKEFDKHPVTRELSQGPAGVNLSNTLNGVGNLFSFIGFYKGQNVIGPIRDTLKDHFDLVGAQGKKRGRKGVEAFTYQLSVPSINSFDLVSRMPWESGNSWVVGIERGISGFSNFMYLKFGEGKELTSKSRSGKGLQSRKTLNAGIFKPIPYITEILNNYRKRLRA
ncbi:hypothetical protein CMI37_10135 [Candidatus Pacearchaeota archaeon]|nr:hypothetical protein [Candidatus Pacearchaeota archaeon]